MANVRRPLDHHFGHGRRLLRNVAVAVAVAVDARKLSIARWMGKHGADEKKDRQKTGDPHGSGKPCNRALTFPFDLQRVL